MIFPPIPRHHPLFRTGEVRSPNVALRIANAYIPYIIEISPTE